MKIKVKKPASAGGGAPVRKRIAGVSGKEANVGGANRKPVVKAKGPGKPVASGGAFGRAKQEKKLQELRRGTPYNVSCPVGGTLTVYIVDSGEPFYRYEHQVGASKTQRGTTFPCIQDGTEPCPLCASEGKTGTYVMYLTCVVPVDKYTKSGETQATVRRYQKKLFPIKVKMAGKYERLFKKRGTFRGQVLKLIRDGKLDPAIGNDFEEIRVMSEAEIKKLAKGQGKDQARFDKETLDFLVKAKIDEPFNYAEIFPRPSAKELAMMAKVKDAGGGGGLGDADFEDGDGFGDEGWGEE